MVKVVAGCIISIYKIDVLGQSLQVTLGIMTIHVGDGETLHSNWWE